MGQAKSAIATQNLTDRPPPRSGPQSANNDKTAASNQAIASSGMQLIQLI
ncbi:hypothetical protein [Leptolyngbya iicbica]|uniref:Uncharacterized protein n=1 Tax=Lyngbya confervoides BDU141951 TaxID=1574623 RepID=A0A8T6QXE6_9CYAN|nr:hypothetical protein [Leptolyngbya sp. LK]